MGRNLRHLSSAACLLSLVAAPVAAQAPVDRPRFAALITQLGAISTLGSLPPDSRCDDLKGDPIRLCQGLIAARRGELSGKPEDARRADDVLTRSVTDHDDWPIAWYALGINRLTLARLKVLSHEGPLLPVGISNEAGGANALSHALRLDPGFSRAADALAGAPMPREGSSALKERLQLLREHRSALSAEGLAFAAGVEREVGSIDSAIALQRRSLAMGSVDSGMVLLDMARNLYRAGMPSSGHETLVAGAAHGTKPSIAAYRAELSWVATAAELATWDSLPNAARSAWIAAFWSGRDVADGRKDGERLIEHYRRIEYAMANYRITLPQNGRQATSTIATPMDYADEYAARQCAQMGRTMNDCRRRMPPGPTAASVGDLAPTFKRVMQVAAASGAEPSSRYYKSIQEQIDDRGVIYIRHGNPSAIARTVGGEALEIWRYERAGEPLVLQFRETDFDGRMDASTLVPTLISLPVPMRNQVCHLEMTLCARSQRIDPFRGDPNDSSGILIRLERETVLEGNRLSPEVIVRSVERGKKAIDLATTTDAFPREFTHKVTPSLQIFGLDRATGGAPRVVVAFAIPGDQLAHTTESGRTIYPVHLQLMAARERDGVRVDLDTLRQFATGAPLTDKQYLSGIIELPAPPGAYGVSLVVTQSDGRGAVAHLGTVVVPGNAARLTASDLVLGREGSGTRWNSGTTTVPLNPLNAWSADAGAEVYFQLSGLTAGESFTTKYEFFLNSDPSKHGPRLTIAGTQVATQSRLEVSRTLGLQNLEPGRYRLVMTATAGGRAVSSMGYLTIVR